MYIEKTSNAFVFPVLDASTTPKKLSSLFSVIIQKQSHDGSTIKRPSIPIPKDIWYSIAQHLSFQRALELAEYENDPELLFFNRKEIKISNSELNRLLSFLNKGTNAQLERITSIDLSKCDQISDVGLAALAKNCPNLHTINLSGCRQISDVGLAVLAQNRPNLHIVF